MKSTTKAIAALEAASIDESLTASQRKAWAKLWKQAANLAGTPVKKRGRPTNVDRAKVREMLQGRQGETNRELFEIIAQECGCSVSMVEKIHQGKL